MARNGNRPEQPRAEPEIIPPDDSRRGPARRKVEFPEMADLPRIYVARLGPVGGVVLLLALVILAVFGLLAFLGALLLWLPIVALIVIAAAVVGILRPRRW